jgi:hypothetical protein
LGEEADSVNPESNVEDASGESMPLPSKR